MIRVFGMIIIAMPVSPSGGWMTAKNVVPKLLCVARPGCTFRKGVICVSVLAHDFFDERQFDVVMEAVKMDRMASSGNRGEIDQRQILKAVEREVYVHLFDFNSFQLSITRNFATLDSVTSDE